MAKIGKKLLAMLIIMSFIIPYASAYAAVYYTNFYSPNRDEYRFGYQAPETTDLVRLTFTSDTGTYYESDYFGVTGIMYLTCNGTYNVKFFNGTTLLDETGNFVTNQIVSPTCQSYSDGGAKNDLAISVQDNEDGTKRLQWLSMPDAVTYEIWKNGEKISETPNTTYNIAPDGGAYTVSAKDATGNIIGESDRDVEPYESPNPTPTPSECDGCQLITDMLSCPAWDDYMSEWGEVIRNNVPPAPDWQQVSNVMRDTIVPAMGQELITRAPELAEIIADEFESREKPVSTPPPAPTFQPPEELPELTDLPEPIDFDLNEPGPVFEPDYTESAPFTIPDPADITLDDTDDGFDYAPDQEQPEVQEKEYTPPAPPTVAPVVQDYYVIKHGNTETRVYAKHGTTSSSPAPNYQTTTPTETSPAPDYQTPTSSPAPAYNAGTTEPGTDGMSEFYEMTP